MLAQLWWRTHSHSLQDLEQNDHTSLNANTKLYIWDCNKQLCNPLIGFNLTSIKENVLLLELTINVDAFSWLFPITCTVYVVIAFVLWCNTSKAKMLPSRFKKYKRSRLYRSNCHCCGRYSSDTASWIRNSTLCTVATVWEWPRSRWVV